MFYALSSLSRPYCYTSATESARCLDLDADDSGLSTFLVHLLVIVSIICLRFPTRLKVSQGVHHAEVAFQILSVRRRSHSSCHCVYSVDYLNPLNSIPDHLLACGVVAAATAISLSQCFPHLHPLPFHETVHHYLPQKDSAIAMPRKWDPGSGAGCNSVCNWFRCI